MKFFKLALCICAIAMAPWALHGQNLEVKISTGNTSSTQSNQASLEAALSGFALEEVTAIEISAGTFTAADWLYLRNHHSKETGLIALANFSITDGGRCARHRCRAPIF